MTSINFGENPSYLVFTIYILNLVRFPNNAKIVTLHRVSKLLSVLTHSSKIHMNQPGFVTYRTEDPYPDTDIIQYVVIRQVHSITEFSGRVSF